MALALCVGALLLGILAERLRRHGVRTQLVLAAVGVLFIAAELALILRLPVPSYLVWAIVGSVGAATVLSFTILAEYFPSEIAGQANAALNILHIGGAFVLQYAIGVIVGISGQQRWALSGDRLSGRLHDHSLPPGDRVELVLWFRTAQGAAQSSVERNTARAELRSSPHFKFLSFSQYQKGS